MRRVVACVLAGLLFAALALQLAPGRGLADSPPAPVSAPQVSDQRAALPLLAYYYIWYDPSSWDHAKIDSPALGRYSSDDAQILRQHIEEAKAAGITGFLVSWKSGAALDRRLQTLVAIARAEKFTLAIIYEALDVNRNPLPVDQVQADLERFADRYATDPVFGVFEKPLLVSGTWKFSPQDVARAVAPVRDRLLVLASERSDSDYERLADTVDGDAYYWSSVDPQRDRGFDAKLSAMAAAVHRHHGLWIAPFGPGFDARAIGGTRVVNRRDGATLREEYAAAVSSSPDALGLISWNEFTENSEVEPSVNYGERALTVLKDLIGTSAPSLGPLAGDSSSSSAAFPGPATLILAVALVAAFAGAVGVLVWLRRRGRHEPSPGAARAPPGRGRRWRLATPRTMVVILVAVLAAAVLAVVVAARPGASAAGAAHPRPPAAGAECVLLRGQAGAVRGRGHRRRGGDIACPPDAAGLGEEEAGQPLPCQQKITADLMGSLNPDAVLVLGDNQYPNGTLARYEGGYNATWGRFKTITYPVAGNHEYGTPGAAGYFDYFGPAAGAPGAGYYSYDLAGWHLVALNSECDRIGGCAEGSPQERWLKTDLAAHPAVCTLAYWHRPRFSSGTHGSDLQYEPLWRDLYAAGADIVLDGHDHDYERFAPLAPDGSADPARGIREFVVGTGGDSHYMFHAIVPGSETRIADVYGVLKLTLRPGGYDWAFAEPGAGAGDSGTGSCH